MQATLCLFVCDAIFVSDAIVVEVIVVRIAVSGGSSFSAKEIAELRDVLRISLADHADALTEADLSDFGASMLQATAVVLKAKYMQKRLLLEK